VRAPGRGHWRRAGPSRRRSTSRVLGRPGRALGRKRGWGAGDPATGGFPNRRRQRGGGGGLYQEPRGDQKSDAATLLTSCFCSLSISTHLQTVRTPGFFKPSHSYLPRAKPGCSSWRNPLGLSVWMLAASLKQIMRMEHLLDTPSEGCGMKGARQGTHAVLGRQRGLLRPGPPLGRGGVETTVSCASVLFAAVRIRKGGLFVRLLVDDVGKTPTITGNGDGHSTEFGVRALGAERYGVRELEHLGLILWIHSSQNL